MTVEEMNHKMLLQILENQRSLLMEVFCNSNHGSAKHVASNVRLSDTLDLLSEIWESNYGIH